MGKGQTSWTSSWSTLACVTRSTAPRDITIWGLRPPCLIIVRWRPNNPTNTHPEGGGGKKGLSRGRLLPPRPALFPPARGPRPRRAVSARRAPRSAARARPPARPPAAGPALRPPTGPALAARSRRLPPATPASRARSMAAQEWDWFQREELIGQISDIRVQNLQGTAGPASPEGPPPLSVGPTASLDRPGAGCRWPGPGLQSSGGGAVRGRECVCTRVCARARVHPIPSRGPSPPSSRSW